jgi:uracil-DNA glycosylase
MLENLLNEYKREFKFDKFYDNLFYNMATWPEFHNQNNNFLRDYPWPKEEVIFQPQKPTSVGNVRVDLPVWFGKADSRVRVIIVGLEPRDTDTKNGFLNIEHKDNHVFATPFALERPVKKYQKSFSPLTSREDVFSYFTDVVKTYKVIDTVDKKVNDRAARKSFWETAEANLPFLKKEFCTIKPTKIIALGNESSLFLKRHFKEYDVIKVRHPARGGAEQCATEIAGILN